MTTSNGSSLLIGPDLSLVPGYRSRFRTAQIGPSEGTINLYLHRSNINSKELLVGNGTRRTTDSEKRAVIRPAVKPPQDVEDSLAGTEATSQGSEAGGGSGSNGSFCTRPQLAEFYATAQIVSGTKVRLVIGQPPTVQSRGGGQIGELTGQTASAMRNCLELGYAMEGTVATRLAPGEIGRVVVKGHR